MLDDKETVLFCFYHEIDVTNGVNSYWTCMCNVIDVMCSCYMC